MRKPEVRSSDQWQRSTPATSLGFIISRRLETLTVRALAQRTGISPAYLCRLANGERRALQKGRWKKVARGLRISVASLRRAVRSDLNVNKP